MADLDLLDAASPSIIVGSDETGVEQTPVSSTETGKLNVADKSDAGGVQGALSVGTSAVEAKVGASALADRATLTIYNNSNSVLYWGYTSGVTTSTGTPLEKKQFIAFEIGPNTPIFLIAGSASNDARITESA